MTANEVFTSLFWLVVIGYLTYLGWFVAGAVRRRRRRHGHLRRARTDRGPVPPVPSSRRTARTTPSPAHPSMRMRVPPPRRDANG